MLVKQRWVGFQQLVVPLARARIGLRLKYIARRLESKTTFKDQKLLAGSGPAWPVSP